VRPFGFPFLRAIRRNRRRFRRLLLLAAVTVLGLLVVLAQASSRIGSRFLPHPATPTATPSRVSLVGDVKVIHANDGDTVTVAGGDSVRYLGIDTPELKSSRTGQQAFASEAAERNRTLVVGKTVRLEADAEDSDGHERLLRHLWVGDDLVAEVLIREGLGYAQLNPPNSHNRERLQQAQAQARAAGRGVWADWPPAPPALALPLARPVSRPADGGPACPAEATLPEQATRLIGRPGLVCLRATRVQRTTDALFLRSGDPPSTVFSALLFPALWASFPDGAERYFEGQAVLLRGRVELYEGKPELIVRDAADARVLAP
jgi:endonuclease YncB( thermonuclease family)